MEFNLKPEVIEQIRRTAQEFIQKDQNGALEGYRRLTKERMERIQKQNQQTGFSLMDTCFCGPTNMTKLLTGTALQEGLLKGDDAWQVYYAMAMEEVLGISTKMEYQPEKNIFLASTPRKEDGHEKIVFDPQDVELGWWDKLCALLGITTDHAQKVAFAKESIKVQNTQLDGFNKAVVVSKKKEFMEKHKDFADHNKKEVKANVCKAGG